MTEPGTVQLTDAEIEALCTAGSHAPSGANAQPWRVTVAADRLTVALDPVRGAGGFLDVQRYASLFGLGCFAENVHIAARALGLAAAVAGQGETVEVAVTGPVPAGHDLAEHIPARVTNRRAGDGTRLAEPAVQRLAGALAGTKFTLTALADPAAKQPVAGALALADAVRMRQPELFAEMVREICWTGAEARARREGLDVATLDLPGGTARLLSALRRVPPLRLALPRARLGDTARQLVASCSHICCLSAPGPLTPAAMVAAGRAMQRLWLTATRDGIWVHPWTVSTLLLIRAEVFAGAGLTAAEQAEVGRVGRGLRAGFGLGDADHPVFVFRLFTGPPPAARSLRLPWQSVTTIQGEPR